MKEDARRKEKEKEGTPPRAWTLGCALAVARIYGFDYRRACAPMYFVWVSRDLPRLLLSRVSPSPLNIHLSLITFLSAPLLHPPGSTLPHPLRRLIPSLVCCIKLSHSPPVSVHCLRCIYGSSDASTLCILYAACTCALMPPKFPSVLSFFFFIFRGLFPSRGGRFSNFYQTWLRTGGIYDSVFSPVMTNASTKQTRGEINLMSSPVY